MVIGGAPAARGGPPLAIITGGPPGGIIAGGAPGGIIAREPPTGAPSIGRAAAPTPMLAICAVGGARPVEADASGCARGCPWYCPWNCPGADAMGPGPPITGPRANPPAAPTPGGPAVGIIGRGGPPGGAPPAPGKPASQTAFADPRRRSASRAGWEEAGSDREVRSRRCLRARSQQPRLRRRANEVRARRAFPRSSDRAAAVNEHAIE